MFRFIFSLAIIYPVLTASAQEIQKEYYDNGKVKLEYKLVDGKPDGIVKMYYESGKPQGELNYIKGIQEGKTLVYYESGKLMKELYFKGGDQCDTMKIYYESGRLQEVSIIRHNMKEGYYRSYYENGQLEYKTTTKQGQIHGYCEHYLENGKLDKKGNYYYGEQVGLWWEYTEAGVSQKKYKDAPTFELPPKVETITFAAEDFKVQYPNSWDSKKQESPTLKLALFPVDAEGVFKENLTVVVQPNKEHSKIASIISYANKTLYEKYASYQVLNESAGKTEQFEYKDVYFSLTRDLGYSTLALKGWTRFILKNEIIYQITFICTEEKYDGKNKEALAITNSFRLIK